MSSPATKSSSASPAVKILPRYNASRGHADHGWLKTFHTFSFSDYYDPEFSSFGALRVINEDRIAPDQGFGTHSHRDFEIFSYVVSGTLEHKDSMGNIETLRRGDIQLTSAGRGISHSEYNGSSEEPDHFLQIWTVPFKKGLEPKYFTRHFSDAQKRDALVPVVAPATSDLAPSLAREAPGPAPVQSPITLSAGLLSPSFTVKHALRTRRAYVHVVQLAGYNRSVAKPSVRISGAGGVELELGEGDGAFVHGEPGTQLDVRNIGQRDAEVLVFDVE